VQHQQGQSCTATRLASQSEWRHRELVATDWLLPHPMVVLGQHRSALMPNNMCMDQLPMWGSMLLDA
jgi:hypothetical protein